MLANIPLFSSSKQQNTLKISGAQAPQNGYLLLQLLHDHSPAVMDALEAKDTAILNPLLWASPKRSDHAQSRKYDTDCPGIDGDTLWLRTAKSGDYPRATNALLRAGANPDKRDSKGRDALSLNASLGHNQSLKTLLDKKSNNDPIEDIRTLFGEPPLILINNQDKQGDTALLKAIQAKNDDAVYLLTQAGVNPDLQNQQGTTALMEALKQDNQYAALRLLKKRNVNVFLQDNEGKTALMHWILNAQPESLSKMLGYMAGRAIFLQNLQIPPRLSISSRLISKSAPSINQQDNAGRTALSYLADSPICQTPVGYADSAMLAGSGSNVDLPDKEGLTPVMRFAKRMPAGRIDRSMAHTAVISRSQHINRQDTTGKTALIHAAENGNIGSLSVIVLNHTHLFNQNQPAGPLVNPNLQDHQGETALMKLAELKPHDFELPLWHKVPYILFKKLIAPRFARLREITALSPYTHPLSNSAHLLQQAGADAKIKNRNGETALMIAAKKGNLPILAVLSKDKDALAQTSAEGYTALEIAARNGQAKAAQMLRASAKAAEP